MNSIISNRFIQFSKWYEEKWFIRISSSQVKWLKYFDSNTSSISREVFHAISAVQLFWNSVSHTGKVK